MEYYSKNKSLTSRKPWYSVSYIFKNTKYKN